MARSQLHKLWHYLRPHAGILALGTLALLVVNGLGTYIPWLIRRAVDGLAGNYTTTTLTQSVLAIAALSTLMWVVRMASRLWLFGVGRQVEYDLKQQLFERLLHLPPSYFATHSTGDAISIATNDVENVRRMLGFAVLSSINTAFAYAMTLPVMLAIDVRLSLLALAVYPLMFLLVQSFSGQMRDEQLAVQERLSEVSTLLQEDLNGIVPIKTYAQEDNERLAFARLNDRLLAANLRLALTRNLLFPLLGGIASVSLLVLVWVGGELLAQPGSDFTVGDLIALIVYVERLIFPTALLGFVLVTYQRGQVSLDRIEAVLSTLPEIADAPDAISLEGSSIAGEIVARDLTFAYPGASAPALDRLSFRLAPGEVVAIVGSVGSGKSTLARALTRLIDIAPGQLFLDGWDITKIRLQDLRRAIAYVPQDSFLFSTTVRDNIRYGRPDAPQSEVEACADRACMQSEILSFPQQYDTLVGERGITLSGGQRQRMTLARALLVDAPILLLDDALSSVDNRTAIDILAGLPTHKTVVFITHNLSAAVLADRIFVMDRGQIERVGTHQELLQTSHLYSKLWERYKLEQLVR